MDSRHPGRGPPLAINRTVSFGAVQLLPDIATAACAGGFKSMRDHVSLVGSAADDAAVSQIVPTLAFEFLLVDVVFGSRGGAVNAADFRDAEDGLPAFEAGGVALRGGKAEAGGGEGSFAPAVVDAGEVPVYRIWGGVAVELVADVDEVLHGCYVDVVDGGEVKDDGFEGGFVGFDGDGLAATRTGVVPGAVLSWGLVDAMGIWDWREGAYAEFGVGGGVGAAGFFEDGGDHEVEVMVGVGVVEAFREAVDEDAWVW